MISRRPQQFLFRLWSRLAVFCVLLVAQPARGDDRAVLAGLLDQALKSALQAPGDHELDRARVAAMQASIGMFDRALQTALAIPDQRTRDGALKAIAAQQIAARDFEGAWRVVPHLRYPQSTSLSICLGLAAAGRGREGLDRLKRLAGPPSSRASALVDFGKFLLSRGERPLAEEALLAAIRTAKPGKARRDPQVRLALAHRWLKETKEWELVHRSLVAGKESRDLALCADAIVQTESIEAALAIANEIPQPARRAAVDRVFRTVIDRGDDVLATYLPFAPIDPSECACYDLRPRLVEMQVKHGHFHRAYAAARTIPESSMKIESLARVAREAFRAGDRTIAAQALRDLREVPTGVIAVERKPEAFANLARAAQSCRDPDASAKSARRCVESAVLAAAKGDPRRYSSLTNSMESATQTLLDAGQRAAAGQIVDVWKQTLVDPRFQHAFFRSEWQPFAVQYARIQGWKAALELAGGRDNEIRQGVFSGVAEFQGQYGEGDQIPIWVERFAPPAWEVAILMSGCEGVLIRLGIDYHALVRPLVPTRID